MIFYFSFLSRSSQNLYFFFFCVWVFLTYSIILWVSASKVGILKENALKDIKNASVKISIEAVENLIKNSIDKNKLENVYSEGIEEIKKTLKQTKV